jgi:hypothetical protein
MSRDAGRARLGYIGRRKRNLGGKMRGRCREGGEGGRSVCFADDCPPAVTSYVVCHRLGLSVVNPVIAGRRRNIYTPRISLLRRRSRSCVDHKAAAVRTAN